MTISTVFEPRSALAARPQYRERYDHFTRGAWVAPAGGDYCYNISPIDGKPLTRAARDNAKNIDHAIDAAAEAFTSWSKTSAGYCSNLLLKIARVIEGTPEFLAIVETINNGRPSGKKVVPWNFPLLMAAWKTATAIAIANDTPMARTQTCLYPTAKRSWDPIKTLLCRFQEL